MNISRIRINEQLGWIRVPQGNIAFHPVRWSSSRINRFSIVLYPRWPTPMDLNLFPRNAALFSAFRRAISPPPSLFLYFSVSVFLACPALYELYNAVYPLNRCSGERCSISTLVCLCACMAARSCTYIRLVPAESRLLWTLSTSRLIIATFREAISTATGCTRWRQTWSRQTRSLIIPWQSRKSREAFARVANPPRVPMLSSN